MMLFPAPQRTPFGKKASHKKDVPSTVAIRLPASLAFRVAPLTERAKHRQKHRLETRTIVIDFRDKFSGKHFHFCAAVCGKAR
jgi:hypothetical protein